MLARISDKSFFNLSLFLLALNSRHTRKPISPKI